MTRFGCSDRIAALLACVALAGAFSGCSDGYPRKDLGLDSPTAGVGASDIVDALNRMNQQSLTSTRWSFSLLGTCELRLAGHADGEAERIFTVQLLHGDLQVKGNLGGPVHAVQVEFFGTPELEDEHLFESERWTDAVEYATHLQALQRLCALSRYTASSPQ